MGKRSSYMNKWGASGDVNLGGEILWKINCGIWVCGLVQSHLNEFFYFFKFDGTI